MPVPIDTGDAPIVFFDGLCGLCDASVQRLLKIDRRSRLRFAPLQSELFQALWSKSDRVAVLPDSVILYSRSRFFLESEAVLQTLREVGGVWRLPALLGSLIPGFLRDRIYRWVARNRYRWFPRREQCRLPDPDERARFLSL